MFRLCLRYAKDRPEAEDLLQEGFVKVFHDLHQFNQSGPLGGWIRRVMINNALQFIRKQKLRFVSSEVHDYAESFSTKEDVIADLNLEMLTKLIQQLPAGYRTIFNLYVIEGFRHKEIAELLDIDVNTSKTQLFKAKKALRQKLEQIKAYERSRSMEGY